MQDLVLYIRYPCDAEAATYAIGYLMYGLSVRVGDIYSQRLMDYRPAHMDKPYTKSSLVQMYLIRTKRQGPLHIKPYEPQRDKTSLRTFGRCIGKTVQMRENHGISIFKITLYLYVLNIIAPN